MSEIIVALLLAAGLFTMIWMVIDGRRSRLRLQRRPLPGELSPAERRRLYQRLGLDPAAMAGGRHGNIVWIDPRIADQRRTDA